MKIILIHSPVDTEKTLGKIKKLNPSIPPTGIAYLASYLRENEIEVAVLDAYKDNLTAEETVKKILEHKGIDAAGFSVSTPGAPLAHKIAKLLKEKNPKITIIFGGVHPTLMPRETMLDASVDFIVKGEGEYTLLELLKKLENSKSRTDKRNEELKQIKGICYRKNGEYTENSPREIIKDLDSLPFPAYDLFDLKNYTPPPHWDLGRPFVSMPILRGCPHNCTFCCLPLGKSPRVLSAARAVEQVEWMIKNFGVKAIMMSPLFPGGKFGTDFCNKIIERGLHKKFSWLSEIRVDYVNPELLILMKRAGCKRVAYGIESGVQKLLDNIKKGITLAQVERASRLAKEAKIEIIAYFIIGLPGETKEFTRQTIDFAKKIDPDFVKFNLAVPYPGTEMYNEAVRDGLLESLDWERFTSFSSMTAYEPIYTPRGMVPQDLMNLQKQALREFYFRPSYILKRILKLSSPREFINTLKTAIRVFAGTRK